MKTVYKTTGTCSTSIEIELDENGFIENIAFIGGCSGNTQGIAALVRGQRPEDVIARLEGIRCGMRRTSCPDQLAIALRQLVNK